MSYPIDDIAHSPRPSQFSYLAARQRVEKVLAQLPAAGGAVQESDSEGRMVPREELVKPVQQVNEVLRRYGVVFRKVLEREAVLPGWRDLLMTYRRLEARGEIRVLGRACLHGAPCRFVERAADHAVFANDPAPYAAQRRAAAGR